MKRTALFFCYCRACCWPTGNKARPADKVFLPEKNITFRATITPFTNITKATLFYRLSGDTGNFTSLQMTNSLSNFSAVLVNITKSIEYYIKATGEISNSFYPASPLTVLLEVNPRVSQAVSPQAQLELLLPDDLAEQSRKSSLFIPDFALNSGHNFIVEYKDKNIIFSAGQTVQSASGFLQAGAVPIEVFDVYAEGTGVLFRKPARVRLRYFDDSGESDYRLFFWTGLSGRTSR